MGKKLLLILLVVCIIGMVFIIENFMRNGPAYEKEKEEKEIVKEPPSKKFNDLDITYFGKENDYQMNADFQNVSQQDGKDIDFKGLESTLIEEGKLIREFSTPEGTLLNKNGILKLNGPVNLNEGNYHLTMNRVDIDLNQGRFSSTGDILLTGPNLKVVADRMESDFDLDKVHFSGRPRLIIKEGDLN